MEAKTPQPAETPPSLAHYTQPPWWEIPLAGVALVLFCVFSRKFHRDLANTGVPVAAGLFCAFVLGCLAAVPLYLSAWIENAFWSRVVFWGGLVFIFGLACTVYVLLS